MSDLYNNLLKATSNIDDITTEKYGVITKLDGLYCSVKETDNELEHNNVPIVNGANLSVGDKVIIGFLNNSIYDVVCYGALNRTVHDTTKQDTLVSGENIKTINNNSILGSGNLVIEGGGTGVDIVTEWETTTSDSKVASEKLTKDTLDTKVDKENGKGLSSNDFTNTYKSSLDNLKTVATSGSYNDLSNKPSIPSKTSDLTNDSNFISTSSTSGLIKNDGTIDTTSYSTFSGSYNDLSNKPSIPSKISDLTNDSDFIEKSNTTGLVKNDGTIDTSAYITSSALNGYQTTSNLVTSFSSTTSDSKYPSEKLVKTQLDNKIAKSSTAGLVKNDGTIDTTSYLSSLPSHNHDDRYYTESEMDTALSGKQATLVSGTNIKTINNTSLLGSGNITIGGGGSGVDIATSWGNPTSDSKVPSEKLTKSSLDDKISKSNTQGLVKNDGTIDTTNYSTFSGNYNDLSNKPTIPTKISDLTNDSDFIETSSTTGLVKNDGTIDTTTYVNTNDSRLSDARTPTAHTHTSSQVTDLINTIYPVGSIYMSVNSTSPETLFGGTWQRIKDTFLLASGDTYSNGSTGGSADAVTVSHTHSFDRAYALTTDSTQGVDRNSSAGQTGTKVNNLLQSNGGAIYRNTINSAGESGTGKNMPPYLAVYVWKRTA